MARCDVCGNEYDKMIQVTTSDGRNHTFDSFECAIHQVAPHCENCGVTIIGHGVESNGNFFCCAHCASQKGVEQARDRV